MLQISEISGYSKPAVDLDSLKPGVGGCEMFTPAEVAKTLGVSKSTVYKLLHDGQLPYVQFGSGRIQRVLRSDLESFIAAHRKKS